MDGRGGRVGAAMAKARMLAPERAPGDPAPEPGLVKKPSRKKNRKKRFWKNKAREASTKPGNDPRGVAVRPPKAPEDFSQNWKVLREVRAGPPRVERRRRACGAPGAAEAGRRERCVGARSLSQAVASSGRERSGNLGRRILATLRVFNR